MRSVRRGPIAALSALSLLLSLSAVAASKDKKEGKSEDKKDEKKEVETEEPAGPTAAAENAETQPPVERNAGPAATTAPGAIERLSFVEHLPGSAFPDPPRGLYGGSVFLNTFHGLQWPYVPRTGIGVSGYGWIDTGYEKITRGGGGPDTVYWLQQGRAVLRITPTYSNGDLFVQGQAELVANKDQSVNQPNVADTDDLWLRIGKWKKWDVQAGRFEGWEVYHLGMALDLNTLERRGPIDTTLGAPPDFYGATNAFYRPSGVGNLAFHVYPTSFLRFEALGQAGNESGYNAIGGRGAGILDFGWLRIKGAGEYRRTTPTTGEVDSVTQTKLTLKELKEERGVGGGVIFMFYPYVEFGANGGIGLVDRWDRAGALVGTDSFTVTSMSGFANFRVVEDLLFGTGVNYTVKDDTKLDSAGKVGHFTNLQAFGAIQYLVAKQLFVKAVVAYAKGSWDPSFESDPINGNINYSNSMVSTRLRLLYLF